MRETLAVVLLVILPLSPCAAYGKSRWPVKIHGFLVGNLAVRATGERPPGGEGGAFVLGEERLRLDISGAPANGNTFFLTKGDLFHDAVVNRINGDLREAYLGYHTGPFDWRFGRQILTWGVGDLFFVNDVFPKDWESFFSGRPMEYLKHGIDAFRMQYSSEALNIDLVATPFFRADALPSRRRFFLYDPFSGEAGQQETTPSAQVRNTEVALRLYRRIEGLDVSFYGYRGFWRTPGARLQPASGALQATRFYPRLVVLGASAQRNFLQGVISLEAGHYGSRDDERGGDTGIPNSQWRLLAGYQRQLARELTVNVQAYAEIMRRYQTYRRSLPPGVTSQERIRGVFSVRLTQLWGYQNWKLSLFVAHSPTDSDYFLQGELSHRLTDQLSMGFGANMFGGRHSTTFFGQMEKNDNVYLNARFDF